MTEHRFSEIVQRPIAAIFFLLALIWGNIYSLGILNKMIDVYAEDVQYREQDLSLVIPAIDSMDEARQPR